MFIEGAEQTGLIIKMGYWALEQACKQLQLWTAQGCVFAPIAVNLSAVQFEHKQLIDTLANLIKKYNVDPNHLINLSSMKYFSFLASFGKLAYLDLSNKPL